MTSFIKKKRVYTHRILHYFKMTMPDLASHMERVAAYATIIGREAELCDHDIALLYRTSILHDVGKVFTPSEILYKTTALSTSEFKEIQSHTFKSYGFIAAFPVLKYEAQLALLHHERYDGKGYPRGIKGSSIPVISHIVSVADVFDALSSERHYKPAWSVTKVMDLIASESGKAFSPCLATVAISSADKLKYINQKFRR